MSVTTLLNSSLCLKQLWTQFCVNGIMFFCICFFHLTIWHRQLSVPTLDTGSSLVDVNILLYTGP